jgi:hypothetical protein
MELGIWYTGIHAGGRRGRSLLLTRLFVARELVLDHRRGAEALGTSALTAGQPWPRRPKWQHSSDQGALLTKAFAWPSHRGLTKQV